MPNLETGVSGYVIGVATIVNYFPVDLKGREDKTCMQCEYFDRSRSRCYLTKKISYYPDKYIGTDCPFRPENGGRLEAIDNE